MKFPSESIHASIGGIGLKIRFVPAFDSLKSKQNRKAPSFIAAKTVGGAHLNFAG